MTPLAEFGPYKLAGLAALIFFGGVVDALAGGGGLVTIPAYLAFGLDPRFLLGTNKLSSCIGTAAASLNYQRNQRLDLAAMAPGFAAALLGAVLGATAAKSLGASGIRILVLVALPLVGWFIYSKHGFGREDRSASLGGALKRRETALALPIGVYDGFFGPGTGLFFALAQVRWCRRDLLGATVRAKFLNLTTNLAALATFLLAGRVDIPLGLLMAAASVAGNWTGSHLGLKNGPKAIRPAVLLVCFGLFAKLLLDYLK